MNAYRDAMNQHKEIARCPSILELKDMFSDMLLLLEQQGETINGIDKQVDTAQDFVKSRNKALVRANCYQKKKRKYFCCCLLSGW